LISVVAAAWPFLSILSGDAFELQAERIENREKARELGVAVFGEHAVETFSVKLGSLREMSDASQGLSNITQREQERFLPFLSAFR
jgi:hypothetical protein